jgi:HSP20 family protein
MVEKAHTAAGDHAWWPSLYAPIRGVGQKIANFFAPQADAAATDDSYEISIELPGVSAEEIDVSVNEGMLTIQGEKKSEHEEKGKTYYFSERTYGAFERSFRLPENALADKISADFKDGVLNLKIPKRGATAETARKIPVGRSDT